MDRRSWPWKKKSSDKAAADSIGTPADQDIYKKPNYVQISVESYSHLTGLEDKVKTCEEQIQTLEGEVKELNEKLSAAQTEMTSKDDLVKQHAKVAEEAVSGWEKAEAEALALKNHLETVTLAKLTAEDRAAHLDGALKECMRQIRNLKEEHELKLQEVVLTKTKQCDKVKLELESKIACLDEELLQSAAEYAALSRSLQERSNMLINISEEKSRAEAEIELLKGNIESCEREINSLKYELHVVSKELEIRNEEKNMSMRSAEVANKQHMEGVKKIAKLEAECQRLRGLVRKKLPGPAALAQMKLEVESLGRDYGETRLRRSPVKPPSPHLSPVPDFTLDNVEKFHKENEFLTERLLAMEEETKMLKEALAKRNSELQASRSMCAKTASKLQSLEAQLLNGNLQKGSPRSVVQITAEGFSSQHASNPPSLTSMSEDGNDDAGSVAESWATGIISEPFHVKQKKNGNPKKVDDVNRMELMDDFLEMEKLACLSNGSSGTASVPGSLNSKVPEVSQVEDSTGKDNLSGKDGNPKPSPDVAFSTGKDDPAHNAGELPLMKLRSRMSFIFESISGDADMGKILEDIKRVVQDAHDSSRQHSVSCLSCESGSSDATCGRLANPEDAGLTAEKEISLSGPATGIMDKISHDLEAAISQIKEFVLFLGKESAEAGDSSPEGYEFNQKIEEFSATFDKVVYGDSNLVDFILDLSQVLAKARGLRFSFLGCKVSDGDGNGPDCIDKVALPESKAVEKDSSAARYQNDCSLVSSPSSDLEVLDDGNPVSGYESNSKPFKLSLQELEELKSEKDSLALDFSRCSEELEMTKLKLLETEQLLAEAKSQLAAAQKSNSLAETQLKCMAESYRSLEARAEELETDVKFLRGKIEALENDLHDERRSHQDALTRCKELEEQLQRHESSTAASSVKENDLQNNQERDLAAAADKLAECQETIFLLSKQLKNLRPQPELGVTAFNDRGQGVDELTGDEPSKSRVSLPDSDQAENDTAASANTHRTGAESPMDVFSSPCSPSDAQGSLLRSPITPKTLKTRPSKSSSSSSSSSGPTPEKNNRGFSRFFSSKGKNGI